MAVPGKILKIRLENENSFLVYDVEVVTADKAIMEVMVDAGSGKTLATKRDQKDIKDEESGEQGEEKVLDNYELTK